MLPPLADLDAMVARLEAEPTGRELTRAEEALNDASTEVRFIARKDWVDDENALVDVPEIVAKTTIECAIRAFLNPPNGIRQEVLADHSITMDGRTGVYLTEDEKAKVRAAAAGENTPSGVWTLRTTRGCSDITDVTDFVAVADGSDPIPYRERCW